MTKVSIIVPIYNVDKFLKRSLESICKQTLKDIEIILVNDGSTDNSLAICKEYENIDSRIVLINQPNYGVSAARNAGLEIAKGEYVGFVDPDDWIDLNMYECLYEQAKSLNAEICMCNYQIEKKSRSVPVKIKFNQEIFEGIDISKKLIANMIGPENINSGSQTIMGSVCRLIVNRNFINENGIRFKNDIALMEDLLFCIEILLKSKRVGLNKGLYYHYVQNSNSAIHMYRENMLERQLLVYKELEKMIKDIKEEDVILENRMSNRYIGIILTSIMNEVKLDNKKNIRDKIFFIKKLCRDKRLKEIINNLELKEYTIRKRLVINAIKKEQALFLYLYYYFLQRIK